MMGIKKIKSETLNIYKIEERNQGCDVWFRLCTTQHKGTVYTDYNMNGDLWICSVYNLDSYMWWP